VCAGGDSKKSQPVDFLPAAGVSLKMYDSPEFDSEQNKLVMKQSPFFVYDSVEHSVEHFITRMQGFESGWYEPDDPAVKPAHHSCRFRSLEYAADPHPSDSTRPNASKVRRFRNLDDVVALSREPGCTDEVCVAADGRADVSPLRSSRASNNGHQGGNCGGSANGDECGADRPSPLGRHPCRYEQPDTDAECRARADDESEGRQIEEHTLHNCSFGPAEVIGESLAVNDVQPPLRSNLG
jgi:hypothetical protein